MNTQIDFIKHSISPRDFYAYEIPDAKLKRHGWNDGGLCPFHSDNKPGSFFVNTETGGFKCFACGTTGGDIIGFTRLIRDLNFTEALEQLSREWGL